MNPRHQASPTEASQPRDWPSQTLDPREVADLEWVLRGFGGPSPNAGGEGPEPSLPFSIELPAGSTLGPQSSPILGLRDREGVLLAAFHPEAPAGEAQGGRTRWRGRVTPVNLPGHWDFPAWRVGAEEIRWWAAEFPSAQGILARRPLSVEFAERWVRDARGGEGLAVLVFREADTARDCLRLRAIEASVRPLGNRARVFLLPRPVEAGADWVSLLQTIGCEPVGPTCRAASTSPSPGPAEALSAEVREILSRERPAQGLVVFMTGLSGSGKSTLAHALCGRIQWEGRDCTLLDGDLVRHHLSSELGFSRAHRELNIRRIGFVAAEIGRHGGVAICCPIAPYEAVRLAVRQMVEAAGARFFLIHVSTPLEVCEKRDRKGLYAKARAGLIAEFTGISDPYETPPSPDLAIDTSVTSVEEAINRIRGALGSASVPPGF